MTAPEKAQYYTDLAEFEAFRANKIQRRDKPETETSYSFSHTTPEEEEALTVLTPGTPILCDGLPGVIAELKDAGWYAVALDNGESKNVRKSSLQRRVE